MKKKFILYVLFFLFDIYGSDKNLIYKNKKISALSSIHSPMMIFLKNHLLIIGISCLLIIASGVVFLFLSHINKEFNKILNDKTPGNKLTKEEQEQINKMLKEDLELFMQCIDLIVEQYERDQKRTKAEEDQDNEERNEKISEEDTVLIKAAVDEFKLITEHIFFKKEIELNKAEAKNSEETPKHTFIEENNERDVAKYESRNIIDALSDSKNCIIERSKILLKAIFSIKEEERRNDFLDKFKRGINLLEKTKLKRFQNIGIANLIKKEEEKINKKKDNTKEINSHQSQLSEII